jgi:hypothetical protein
LENILFVDLVLRDVGPFFFDTLVLAGANWDLFYLVGLNIKSGNGQSNAHCRFNFL